jgi:hypothetical protein
MVDPPGSCPRSARTWKHSYRRDRGDGRPWTAGPPVEVLPAAVAVMPIRIGSARCSTAQLEPASQLAALEPACKRICSEKIFTRIKTRPELEKALKLACDLKEAAPEQEVIPSAHELRRPARNAAELMALSGQAHGSTPKARSYTVHTTVAFFAHGLNSRSRH